MRTTTFKSFQRLLRMSEELLLFPKIYGCCCSDPITKFKEQIPVNDKLVTWNQSLVVIVIL